MHKKRALVLWAYLCLLGLAACGPKLIDDYDLVYIDYTYTLDWTVVEQWSDEIVVWENSKYEWLESAIRWAKQNDEFKGTINGGKIYGSEYSSSNIQSYPNIILSEVMWIDNPAIWNEIEVNSIWKWIITSVEKDSDWYDVYVVDFNDPKTYADLSYSIKITGIEKK